MVYHDVLKQGNHGKYQGILWNTMVYYGIPWYTMEYHMVYFHKGFQTLLLVLLGKGKVSAQPVQKSMIVRM